MELFRTNDFYIFVSGEYSLWWDRQTGAFIPKTGWDLTDADDPVCLGVCDGIVGKVEHCAVFNPRLLLIKESILVGKFHGESDVYKIKSVVFLPQGPDNVDLGLTPCHKHQSHMSSKRSPNNPIFDIQKNPAFSKTWGTLKSAGNTIKNTTQQAAAIATGTPKKRDFKDKDKFEKQIIEEFYKIFNDTNSFYYSKTTDLTNSLQRLCLLEKDELIDYGALWKTVDDKFFWNKHMLKDLIDLDNNLCDPWILPIIQGFIQIEDCKVEIGGDFPGSNNEQVFEIFTLCIISRRSRFRAGTRYKRRGVDEDGECANYVETEQIVTYKSHEVSFVQVRGSVPVYWSQPGYKYRPPPRIDKGDAETKLAFAKHFDGEISKYGPVCIINLIDQSGKEKVVFDAYSNHVLQYDSCDITYVTFDFHEYCKGMHFENVSVLLNAIADIIKDMNYCWKDRHGHICSQNGVFRVNCIDCLDRTNVLQTALGKAVMEIQFCKLGLITPDGVIPDSIKSKFQLLWANNGDTISKQYAGTNALKGDYTRTGERKFTGIMKDGMNSANRYYKSHFKDSVRQCCLDVMLGVPLHYLELNDFWAYVRVMGNIASEHLPKEMPSLKPHFILQQEFELANVVYQMSRYYLSRFKDTTRQGTIDLMLGNGVSEAVFTEAAVKGNSIEDERGADEATAEHVRLLIEDCRKLLLSEPDRTVASWGLVNADPTTGDPSETEMDSVLILTPDSYLVADYDDQVDRVTNYQHVPLANLTLLECGYPELGPAASLFRTAGNKGRFCIRLNYTVDGQSGYYHMFRSTHLRFFNNMAVPVKNEEEEIESLKAVCESILAALEAAGLPSVPYSQGRSLERRKSRALTGRGSPQYLDIASFPHITRNLSETQLTSLKNVGNKALSNVTQQFSKLNKIGGISNSFKSNKSKFTIGFSKASGGSSSDEEDVKDVSLEGKRGGANFHKYAVGGQEEIEVGQDCMLLNIEPNISETFLPGVGIVMGSAAEPDPETTLQQKQNLLSRQDSAQLDDIRLSTIVQEVSLGPQIEVCWEGERRMAPPDSLRLESKLSASSGAVCYEGTSPQLTTNDYKVTLGIAQSQSESALKSKLANITSPVSNATRDLVLSPFSKLAKGVQSLGANLDPRKLGGTQVRYVSEREMEEHRKLQDKWQHCKTRLVAL